MKISTKFHSYPYTIIVLFAVQIFFNGCYLNKKLPKLPTTPSASKIYLIPKAGTLMPDEIARNILKKYVNNEWIKKPWIYCKRYQTKIFADFRNMKITVPYYEYHYRWYKRAAIFRPFRPPVCCLHESLYISEGNFRFVLDKQKKCDLNSPQYRGVTEDFNLEKYKNCVFIVGAQYEHTINYHDNYDGTMIICACNKRERNKIIEALIALNVKY